MRILITGGFGYIGGRLACHLARQGHRVVIAGRRVVAPPLWLPEAEVVRIDWDDARSLVRLCDGIDMLVHAAGMNAQDSFADPVGALRFNGVATASLVEAAANVAVPPRFFYLSTAHVYSPALVGEIDESSCTLNRHPYACSHLAGENALLGAITARSLDGLVLRLSNAFGPPVDPSANCWMLLANDLCRQAVTARRLVLHSSGRQLRDFIPIAEVCRAIEWLAALDADALPSDRIMHIGSGRSRSVLDMAMRIRQLCPAVLGYEPVIEKPESAEIGVPDSFRFRTQRLSATGFVHRQCDDEEVMETLHFCKYAFGIG